MNDPNKTYLKTNDSGIAKFDMPCSYHFNGVASKDDFLDLEFDKSEFLSAENLKEITILLYNPSIIFEDAGDDQMKLKLPPIYFDLGSWKITDSGALVLGRVIKVLDAFPDMMIKIESHTDSRDSDKNNLLLSSRRAIATRDYLYSKGIDESRIIDAVGYGEFRLLNNCKDGVTCSEDLHQENRRSNFIIVNDKE